ncbi:regucalcin-like isoform X2 [Contarinia nasturtii]|uniref:regucalcin-like isoform X2 n=1 Tax=Contarinia nasturtii TaxID=265458 RepID=UPI0012D4A7F3|nr:regucalcin-like isoform X2 [Contarinia nasturtii]
MYTLCASLFLLINFAISHEVIEPLSCRALSQPYAPFYDHLINCKHRFIIGNGLDVILMEWNGKSSTIRLIRAAFRVHNAHKYSKTVWSLARISPTFQFYAGTFCETICGDTDSENAALFQYIKPNHVTRRIKHFKLAGDFEWNIEERLMYVINSCCRTLLEFQWNPETGALCHGRIVYEFKNNGNAAVIPLGLTIDTEGCVYVGMYNGGEIKKINPKTGKCVKTFKMPATAISALSFGGPKNDILFVTSQSHKFNITNGGLCARDDHGPSDGLIFMVKDVNAKGVERRKMYLDSC